MGIDYLSPVAPAKINALLVPAGRLQKQKFAKLVARLEQENVVRLGDVSPDGQSNKSRSPLITNWADRLIHLGVQTCSRPWPFPMAVSSTILHFPKLDP